MCDERSMSRRVKVLFHDNCFDGAASASLFSRFYKKRDRPDGASSSSPARRTAPATSTATAASTATSTRSSTSATRRTRASTGGSITTSRRSRRPPTRRTSARIRARTSSSIRRRAVHQVPAPSSCAEKFGWDWSAYDELVHWADIIDGAQFESPQAAVELAEPALQLMTWVENNQDPALKRRFIEELTTRPLAEIAAESYVDDGAGADPARRTSAASTSCARAPSTSAAWSASTSPTTGSTRTTSSSRTSCSPIATTSSACR